MSTQYFSTQELEHYFDNDRIQHEHIEDIGDKYTTYQAVLTTEDNKHYAVTYSTLNGGSDICFHAQDCVELFKALSLTLGAKYTPEKDAQYMEVPELATKQEIEEYRGMLEVAREELPGLIIPKQNQ